MKASVMKVFAKALAAALILVVASCGTQNGSKSQGKTAFVEQLEKLTFISVVGVFFLPISLSKFLLVDETAAAPGTDGTAAAAEQRKPMRFELRVLDNNYSTVFMKVYAPGDEAHALFFDLNRIACGKDEGDKWECEYSTNDMKVRAKIRKTSDTAVELYDLFWQTDWVGENNIQPITVTSNPGIDCLPGHPWSCD